LKRISPVDRQHHRAEGGGGAVEQEKFQTVLADDADPVASADPCRPEPGGQSVGHLPDVQKGSRPAVFGLMPCRLVAV